MKKMITGVKPTGNGMHIWNYFWAIHPFIEFSKNYESFLMIADYHSLTSVHDGDTLRKYKANILNEYMSLVPDESNIIIFEQSKIRRINDITWILSSVTPYSLMLRAHCFKDSQAKNSDINMAVFNYPILMSSDILAYDVDIVPVGKDQIQHVEFTRDIALSFNKTYNTDFFVLPTHSVSEEVAVIPWIDGRKMSKSYNNFIPIFDDEKKIKKLIMSMVTDDTPLEAPKNPDTCNVFSLIKLVWNQKKVAEIRVKYVEWNYWYGHAKQELCTLFLEYFWNARKKYENFSKNPDELTKKLEEWNKKMNEIADKKYEQLCRIVGL